MIIPTRGQFVAARTLARLSQNAVAAEAGIHRLTYQKLELVDNPATLMSNITKVLEVFAAHGVELREDGWVRLNPNATMDNDPDRIPARIRIRMTNAEKEASA